MSLFKILASLLVGLLCTVGLAAIVKNRSAQKNTSAVLTPASPVQIKINQNPKPLKPASSTSVISQNTPPTALIPPEAPQSQPPVEHLAQPKTNEKLPEANRIEELFNTTGPTLPIVETITYRSHVSWQKGRPAWLSDYANHYHTNLHFIARSINGKPNYSKQEISEGGRFNVLRNDKNFRFQLVVDTSRCKLWLYYVDLDENQKGLIKTYSTCLGRIDSTKASGLLTPLGTYLLGKKTAIYDDKISGNYRGKKIVMKTVFGTRWIPFEKEIGPCTLPAKSFGIHGAPWVHQNGDSGPLVEQSSSIGKYDSDGCIRLSCNDIEEIFAIISTRPTYIEIVHNFLDSTMAQE
jgi:hypothetical protein